MNTVVIPTKEQSLKTIAFLRHRSRKRRLRANNWRELKEELMFGAQNRTVE